MADELNIITSDANSVNVTTEDNSIVITNDSDTTTITLSAAETTTIQIATVGPQGPKGDTATSVSASYAITASFAETASYALNAGAGAGFPYSGSAVITGSLFVTAGITGSFSGSVIGYVPNTATGSFITNNQTGSMTVGTASYYNETDPLYNAEKAKYLTTGSLNTTQTISGSLIIDQNLIVLGSQSIQYITSSQLNISTNLITVNTATPAVRFGGLAVYDSGSSPIGSGSFLYDSVQDEFIFVHKGNGTNITSSHFLVGPETYDDLGNETYITANTLLKSQGNEHVTSSNISDTGTLVNINSNTTITGSLNVSAGITASLQGTASWATNFASASNYVLNSQTGSFATTGSNTFRGNQTISGSLTITGSTNINGTAGTTLFSANADTLIITGSLITSGSVTFTGSLGVLGGVTATSFTGSFSGSVVGYVPNTTTASFITTTQTGSFVTTSSFNSFTSSINLFTSSVVRNSQTASFATTGSNTFIGNQSISGSFNLSGSMILQSIAAGNASYNLRYDTGTKQVTYYANGEVISQFATSDEINIGTNTNNNAILPAQLEASKHSTINIFNHINFT
jgi:hypothetical protein